MAEDNVALLELANGTNDDIEETVFSAAGPSRTVKTVKRKGKKNQSKLLRIATLFFVLTIVITSFYLLMNGFTDRQSFASLPFSEENIETPLYQERNLTESERKEMENQKVVLFWTNYFSGHWETHFEEFGGKTLPGSDDPSSNASCLFTTDRSKLSESNAVVFHGRNFDFNDLPKTRTKSQRWVFYLLESPTHSYYDDNRWAAATKLGFNWTMTYTTASDIFCPYCQISTINSLPNRTIDENEMMKIVDNRTQNWAQNFSNRSRDALWFVSNCGGASKRNELAEELRKNGIKVDSFGGCSGKRPDPIINQIGPEAFFSKYKFYLAFENSLCDDYVSWSFCLNKMLIFLKFR